MYQTYGYTTRLFSQPQFSDFDYVTQKILPKLILLAPIHTQSRQVFVSWSYLTNKFNISKCRSKELQLIVLEKVSERVLAGLSLTLYTY